MYFIGSRGCIQRTSKICYNVSFFEFWLFGYLSFVSTELWRNLPTFSYKINQLMYKLLARGIWIIQAKINYNYKNLGLNLSLISSKDPTILKWYSLWKFYSRFHQTSKLKLFVRIVKDLKTSSRFAKSSILDASQSPQSQLLLEQSCTTQDRNSMSVSRLTTKLIKY